MLKLLAGAVGGLWPSLNLHVFANGSWPLVSTYESVTRFSSDIRCTNINDDGLLCLSKMNGTTSMVRVAIVFT